MFRYLVLVVAGFLSASISPAAEKLVSGDETGRHADKDKKKGEPPSMTNLTNEEQERASKFDTLDEGKVGKVTRDYFITHRPDTASTAENFTKWDSDKDGFLSREEFVMQGKPK